MIVSIDTSSAVPAYEQIRTQVTALADSGALPARTRLPSVRQLAADLGVAPGTVAKAYQQLEETGITTAHRRRGTLINDRTTSSEEAPAPVACEQLPRSTPTPPACSTLTRSARLVSLRRRWTRSTSQCGPRPNSV